MTDAERELLLEIASLLKLMADNSDFSDYTREVSKLVSQVKDEEEIKRKKRSKRKLSTTLTQEEIISLQKDNHIMETITLQNTRETPNYIVFENSGEGFKTNQYVAKVWIPRKEFQGGAVPVTLEIAILDDEARRLLGDRWPEVMSSPEVMESRADAELGSIRQGDSDRPIVDDGYERGW